jgi:sporulation protein YlmC with PRC-barrel domain
MVVFVPASRGGGVFPVPAALHIANCPCDGERRAGKTVFSASISDEEELLMFAKYLTAGVAAGSLLLAGAAFAAENATTPSTSSDRAGMSQGSATNVSFQGNWRASKVVGLNVYNDQNENVGSINDLLMDKSGNVKAAVISVGGFLGMGSRYVAVAFDKIKFSDQPVAYTSANSTAPGGGGMARPDSSSGSTTTTGSAAGSPPASASKPNPWYPDHAVFNATKDELQNMPEFKYSTE